MFKRFAIIASLALSLGAIYIGIKAPVPAAAQGNPTCPTRSLGDSSNACASTAFVQNQFATPTLPLPNTQIYVGNVAGHAAAVAMSGDCTIANTGAITCLKSNGTAFGTAAFQNTGTSGANIPFLNGNNTWSGTNTLSNTTNFTGPFQINGNAMTFPATAATLVQSIGSTTIAMATSAISSGTCTAAQTGTIIGATTTDIAQANFVGDVSAVTGLAPNATTGNIYILGPWVSATNTVTIKECNSTAGSITPGAHSILVRIAR